MNSHRISVTFGNIQHTFLLTLEGRSPDRRAFDEVETLYEKRRGEEREHC